MEEQIQYLTSLFRRRWALPVLVELDRFDGVGLSTLSHRLWQTSRHVLDATLEDLVQLSLVEPRRGTKYFLTSHGKRVARDGAALLFHLRKLRAEDAALRKWSLPVTFALGQQGKRFNDLKRALPGITARVLAIRLRALQRKEFVYRFVFFTYAPRTFYQLTPRVRRIIPLLARLSMHAPPASNTKRRGVDPGSTPAPLRRTLPRATGRV